MEGKGGRVMFGDKEIAPVTSWSLKVFESSPMDDEKIMAGLLKEAASVEFTGTYDPDPILPLPLFEVGETYDFVDHLSGVKFKVKCVSEDEDGHHFRGIGEMEKIKITGKCND